MKTAFLSLLVILLCSTLSFAQSGKEQKDSCSILHAGVFTYGDETGQVRVHIKGKMHIEYHEEGKYIIKSKLKWINSCEYTMTLIKTTIPDFPYKKGDEMHVKVTRVDGKDVYYSASIKGENWQGKLTRVE